VDTAKPWPPIAQVEPAVSSNRGSKIIDAERGGAAPRSHGHPFWSFDLRKICRTGNFFPTWELFSLSGHTDWLVSLDGAQPDARPIGRNAQPFSCHTGWIAERYRALAQSAQPTQPFGQQTQTPNFLSVLYLYPFYYYLYLLLNRLGRLDRLDKGLVLLSFFAYPTSAQEDGEVRQRPKVLDLLAFLYL
jgi:hypothetical protein